MLEVKTLFPMSRIYLLIVPPKHSEYHTEDMCYSGDFLELVLLYMQLWSLPRKVKQLKAQSSSGIYEK